MTDITIITPSFNQGQYIQSFFDSYREAKNNFNSTQLILVDNCSTDSTSTHIRENLDIIDNLIVEPDSGQSNAINKALPHVEGRYVNWINTDDRLAEDAFSLIYSSFVSTPSADVLIGKCRKLYPQKRNQSVTRFSTLGLQELLPYSLLFGQIIQPSTFWRTSVFMKYMPLREDLHCVMDHALFLQYLIENGPSALLYVDQVLSTAILHDHCKSMKLGESFKDEYANLYKQLINKINSGNVSLSATMDHQQINDMFARSEDFLALSRLFKRSSRFGMPIPQREFFKTLLRPRLLYVYLTLIRPTLHRINSL